MNATTIALVLLAAGGVGAAMYFMQKDKLGEKTSASDVSFAGFGGGQSTPDRQEGDSWGSFLTGLGSGVAQATAGNFFGSGYSDAGSGSHADETSWFGGSEWSTPW